MGQTAASLPRLADFPLPSLFVRLMNSGQRRLKWEESGPSELARKQRALVHHRPRHLWGSFGLELRLYGNPEKIRLKSCPGKAAVVQGELRFNACGKFFVVLIQSVAAAEGEAHEGGNGAGAGWQGGDMVTGLLQKEEPSKGKGTSGDSQGRTGKVWGKAGLFEGKGQLQPMAGV